MGRLAQVLSIGVKGTVEIELLKREFYAGEYVVGHVKLHLNDTIDAEGFVLALIGKEHLSWRVQQGKNSHYHHIKQEVLHHQLQLVQTATTFPPGDYIFPFQLQLPPGLCSTFSMCRARVERFSRVMSSVLYRLKADVKVKGMLSANLGSKQMIAVHALPLFPFQPPHALEDNVSQQVSFLCCFNQGTCTIKGATSTNHADVVNGVVRVQASVRNNSSRPISAVYVRLYQDLTIHIPQGYSHSGERLSNARLLHQVQVDAVTPGASTDDILADISIAKVASNIAQSGKRSNWFDDGDSELLQIQPFAQPAIHPTTDLVFVSISYHIEIFCSIPWCLDAKLEFPLGVFQPPIMVQVPVAPT